MGLEINLRITTKNLAADPEIGLLTKSISKTYGRATAMPPAWESSREIQSFFIEILSSKISPNFFSFGLRK